jgi:DNA-binding response OmpR family regulator
MSTDEKMLTVADVVLDVQHHIVTRGAKQLILSRKEFTLLEYLMRNAGLLLTRQMILEHVWDTNADPFTNTVEVHIRYLRRKLDEGFKRKLIQTVHGYGYKFE